MDYFLKQTAAASSVVFRIDLVFPDDWNQTLFTGQVEVYFNSTKTLLSPSDFQIEDHTGFLGFKLVQPFESVEAFTNTLITVKLPTNATSYRLPNSTLLEVEFAVLYTEYRKVPVSLVEGTANTAVFSVQTPVTELSLAAAESEVRVYFDNSEVAFVIQSQPAGRSRNLAIRVPLN